MIDITRVIELLNYTFRPDDGVQTCSKIDQDIDKILLQNFHAFVSMYVLYILKLFLRKKVKVYNIFRIASF